MKNLKTATATFAGIFLGVALGSIFAGKSVDFVIFLCFLGFLCLGMWTTIHFLFKEEGVVAAEPLPYTTTSVYRSECDWGVQTAATGVLAHLQVAGEKTADGLGTIAEHSLAAILARPAFYAGLLFLFAAITSGVGGMLSWWALWKGFHVGGVLALISAGFFLEAYDKWSDVVTFLQAHKVATFVVLSVTGLIISLIHLNRWGWWPVIIFAILTTGAIVTACEGWGKIGEFAQRIFFGSGAWSVLATTALISFSLIGLYELSKGLGVHIPVDVQKGAAMVIMGCIIAFGTTVAYIVWKKKK